MKLVSQFFFSSLGVFKAMNLIVLGADLSEMNSNAMCIRGDDVERPRDTISTF